MYLYLCLSLPRDYSFYRQITGYGMNIDDHKVHSLMMKGVMGKQISYMTLFGVHSTVHLMHLSFYIHIS